MNSSTQTQTQRHFLSAPPALSRIGHSRRLLLMLDFDGTLAPITTDPAKSYLSPEIKAYLSTISRMDWATIAVLSGRSLADVKKRIGLKNIYYAGSHGLEIYGPSLKFLHPEASHAKSHIEDLRTTIENKLGSIHGAIIERKRFSFSFHYRLIKTRDTRRALNQLRSIICHSPIGEEVSIIKGKKVIEVVPRIDWNKGAAVRYVIKHTGRRVIPIYLGDDVTDETAFEALRKVNGVAIRIGRSKRTAAPFYLRDQSQILSFLRFILSLDRQRQFLTNQNVDTDGESRK